MSLQCLPAELHVLLLDYLDTPSLIRIRGTNKYFRAFLSQERIKTVLADCEFSRLMSNDDHFTKPGLRPCYYCMSILPATAFDKLMIDLDRELSSIMSLVKVLERELPDRAEDVRTKMRSLMGRRCCKKCYPRLRKRDIFWSLFLSPRRLMAFLRRTSSLHRDLRGNYQPAAQ